MKYWNEFWNRHDGALLPLSILSVFGLLAAAFVLAVLAEMWFGKYGLLVVVGVLSLVPLAVIVVWYRSFAKDQRLKEVVNRMGV